MDSTPDLTEQSASCSVAIGDVLSDRYAVIDVRGEGGMAVVFEGKHMRLGNRVAIKVLNDEYAADEEVRIRFDREARAVAQLTSKYVARVFDVDETESGVPYFVMEYLEGYELDELIDAGETIPVDEAVDFILQACSGMAEAHAKGIVHRDLKPPNLFYATDGPEPLVKILDFGISKIELPGEQQRMTKAMTAFGTPAYMSPEQIQSARDVDARADVWSLGVILYELLTLRLPFKGENAAAIIWSISASDAPTPHELRRDVPPALSDAVMRALCKERHLRYQSVAELAEALAPFGDGSKWEPPNASAPARRTLPSQRELTESALPTMPVVERTRGARSNPPWTTERSLAVKRTRAAVGIAGALGVIVIVAAVIFAVVSDTAPEAQPVTPTADVSPAANARDVVLEDDTENAAPANDEPESPAPVATEATAEPEPTTSPGPSAQPPSAPAPKAQTPPSGPPAQPAQPPAGQSTPAKPSPAPPAPPTSPKNPTFL